MVAEDRQAVVDNVLAQFFRAQLSRARTLDASYVDLWRSLEANTVGGKRFRPRMVSLAYDALGGIEVEPCEQKVQGIHRCHPFRCGS